MFEVLNKDKEKDKSFPTLDLAMVYAKFVNEFVTIKGPEFEVVGRFGSDSVENGRTPDGVEYSWRKRR